MPIRVTSYDPPMEREFGGVSKVHATVQHENIHESVYVIEEFVHPDVIIEMFEEDNKPHPWKFWIAIGYSWAPPAKLALTPDQARCMANLLIRAADLADELKAKQE